MADTFLSLVPVALVLSQLNISDKEHSQGFHMVDTTFIQISPAVRPCKVLAFVIYIYKMFSPLCEKKNISGNCLGSRISRTLHSWFSNSHSFIVISNDVLYNVKMSRYLKSTNGCIAVISLHSAPAQQRVYRVCH